MQSATGRKETPIFPIGLAYLAGQLENHDVRILDLSLTEGNTASLERELEYFEPEVLGISLRNIDDSTWPVTHSYIPPFTAILESLRSWKGVVVAGGTGFSIYSEVILEQYPRIDFGLPGEGDVVFPQLLAHVNGGVRIPGWDGGRLLPSVPADLAAIRLPDYSVFDMKPYFAGNGVGVQSRRGCPFGCTYCTYGFLSGREFRPRPIGHVVADIENLARLGASNFQFVDSIFNCPGDYFESLLEALEEADTGVRWGAWLDTGVTPEQLDKMTRAGAETVDFSPDAITAKGLRLLGKKNDPRHLYPAVRAARKAGMHVGVNFFNGNPGEGTLALLAKFLFMARARLTLGWSSTFVNLGTIRAYAHSRIAEQMLKEGRVPPDCDFFAPVFYRQSGLSDWLFRLFSKIRGRRKR